MLGSPHDHARARDLRSIRRAVRRARSVTATFEGIPGHDTELTDYSPDAIEERRLHARTVFRDLNAAPVADDHDRIAAEVLRQHLLATIDVAEASEDLRPLRVIGSPVSDVRICFDLLARSTLEDWETIAARAAAVPHALDTLIEPRSARG